MKRNKMIWDTSITVYNKHMNIIKMAYEFYKEGNWSSSSRAVRLLVNKILTEFENQGMKPPLSECKLVEDTYHGGLKHSKSEHKWDEE